MKPQTYKAICAALVLALIGILITGCGESDDKESPSTQPVSTDEPTALPQEVVLTMGAWRTDDVEQMNHILAQFHEISPN
jgi:hypothetical protein